MKSNEKLAIFWLRWMGNIGVSLSLTVFLLYISDLIPSKVEPAAIVANWSEKAPVYLEKMDLAFGRGWLAHIKDLYLMNVAAIAILISAALPTLLTLSFMWYRKRDFLFGTTAIAIFAILTVAIIGPQ